jgi:hypothetical protein
VTAVRGCRAAICDKVSQSARGSIIAITDLIVKRGSELREGDVSRITQALFGAAASLSDRVMSQQVLEAMCSLGEHAQAKVVFDEILTAAEKDVARREGTKQRGAWPVQEAFLAVAHHKVLSLPFLDHVVVVLNQVPLFRDDDVDKADSSERLSLLPHTLSQLPQAATLALGAILRGGNDVARRAVEQRYPAVLSALILRIGSCHGTTSLDTLPLRYHRAAVVGTIFLLVSWVAFSNRLTSSDLCYVRNFFAIVCSVFSLTDSIPCIYCLKLLCGKQAFLGGKWVIGGV